MRAGVGFTPFETRADVVLRLGTRADELGFAQVGAAEGWTHDATVLLTQLAGRTSRIGLASAVLPVWRRTPATLAMAAAGLQRRSGGRSTLGLGAGSPPLAEGVHGVAWDRPVARVRDTLTAVRALLLAGAWVPFLWARGRIREGRALVREGEARAADPAPTEVAVSVPVALAPTEEEEEARRLAAWWAGTYVTRMGPLHPRVPAEGFGMTAGATARAGRVRP